VRTQLPYALTVGLVATLAGSIPVAMGMPWWLGMLIGAVSLVALLKVLGQESLPPAANELP
jgi:Na+/H+ antiporter NhaC